MKFTGALPILEVDKKFLKRDFVPSLTKIWAEALRDFATVTASHIPVWSGMALASFSEPVMRAFAELGEPMGEIRSPSPVAGAPNRIAEGVALGSVTQEIGNAASLRWRFVWTTLVPHFFLDREAFTHPSFNLKTQPPWKATERGIEAWRSSLESKLRSELKNLRNLVKVVPLKMK